MRGLLRSAGGWLLLLFAVASLAAENQGGGVGKLIGTIRQVGPKGEGNREAAIAWKQLSAAGDEQLLAVLAGMDGANPLAENWLRSAAETIAQRTRDAGKKLPQQQLEAFVLDTKHAPRSRRLAFELVAAVDPSAEQRLIPQMIDDPSIELRREAVAQAIAAAGKLLDDGKNDAARRAFARAYTSARDFDQVKTCNEALARLGQDVDLPRHFGFIQHWHLIAPFDNTGGKGFDTAYPPEKNVDLAAEYEGKNGPIRWQPHAESDEYGKVDLAATLDKFKGAVAYAFAEFESDADRPVDLRLGSINANKVWLNGKLLGANEVYHAGTAPDQYRMQGQLGKGRNTILVKICQNEQTEPWAQDWAFQLRICDEVGTAVLAANRRPTPPKPAKNDEKEAAGS